MFPRPLHALGFAPTLLLSRDQVEVAASKGMVGRMERAESRGHGLLELGLTGDPLTPKVPETGWAPSSLWWDPDEAESPVLALKPSVQVLTPHSPGSAWRACSRPWYRRPGASWCGSSAKMTPPWSPTPGGRKMGSPSPLTGVCVAADPPPPASGSPLMFPGMGGCKQGYSPLWEECAGA